MSRRIHGFALAVMTLVVAALVGAQSTGATIVGSVVDAALSPLTNVTVTLLHGGKTAATATTDRDGKFKFSGVAPGDYQVRAEQRGGFIVTRALHVPTDAKMLQLPLVAAPPPTVDRAEIPSRVVGGLQTAPPPPPAQAGARGAGSGGGGRGAAGVVGGVANGVSGGMPGGVVGGVIGGLPPSTPALRSSGADQASYWAYPPSDETYAPIDPNRFELTRANPLSTFGADVDTGSYTNIRRFLSAGQLPPHDAVRIEELLNYFRFDYAAPHDGAPIAITTEIGDCPWAPSHKLVLIGARATASPSREVPGRNIVLLIDVSGSMQPPDRLPLIKTALLLFAETLRPDDTLSIVTYAGTSGVALPPTPARYRELIARSIDGLAAGGSTNGAAGLVTAYRVARQAFVPGGVNRVILATDGDFNVGLTSQQDLLRLIARERDSGVFLSVFGVGRENLKDQTMEMLADHGNGHYAYLDSLQEARRVLLREGDATLETVAKDVKFQVEFNPAEVQAWKLLGYEKRALAPQDFNDDRKDAGEMGAGHTVTVLYEVVPAGAPFDGRPSDRPDVDPLRYQQPPARPSAPSDPRSAHDGEWLTVKTRYKQPEGETSELITQHVRGAVAGRAFLPFASAVAEFGLLLRDDVHDAERWDALARRVRDINAPGIGAADRDAFSELVGLAATIARVR